MEGTVMEIVITFCCCCCFERKDLWVRGNRRDHDTVYESGKE